MSAAIPRDVAAQLVQAASNTDGSDAALDKIAADHGMMLPELTRLLVNARRPRPAAAVTKACTKCGETKPLIEFFPNKQSRDGRASWCRKCNSKRAPTPSRLIEGRARGRAYRRLAKNHPEEFERLFAEETAAAVAEHERVQAVAAAKGQTDAATARLKVGPKRAEETDTVQRLDVARCAKCHRHHDAGHVCPGCGESTAEKRQESA